LNNPKNPYRIADYFQVDEDYGGNEQLAVFIKKAHKLGLKVMLDLVYYHCAPNAKLIEELPDGVMRDANGEILYGEWNFPRLNFNSRALRAYLIRNMTYFVQEYGVDAYRCDVGDYVPLDFWQEAVAAVKKVSPNVLFLNEGENPNYVLSGVFDWNYSWKTFPKVFETGKPCAQSIKAAYAGLLEDKMNGKTIWYLENHDTVTDIGRADVKYSFETCDCLFVYYFTAEGVPFLYCGNEIADCNEHNMFATRLHNRGYGIDWSNALLPHGKRRLALIKKLCALRKSSLAIACGDLLWIDSDEDTLAYVRTYQEERLCVYIRFGKGEIRVEEHGEILLAHGYKNGILKENGYVIFKR